MELRQPAFTDQTQCGFPKNSWRCGWQQEQGHKQTLFHFGLLRGSVSTVQKKLLISFREIIKLIGVLVGFLHLRGLTVDHQDFDPRLCFSKFPLTAWTWPCLINLLIFSCKVWISVKPEVSILLLQINFSCCSSKCLTKGKKKREAPC